MSIWQIKPDLKVLADMDKRTINATLGIVINDVGDDYLAGSMPVDERTHQPMGILHGGASVVLAETLGSIAAYHCVDVEKQYCVGLEINANHIRSVRSGRVRGIARPIHRGKTTQVWEIRISDEQERLTCISRITMAVLDR